MLSTKSETFETTEIHHKNQLKFIDAANNPGKEKTNIEVLLLFNGVARQTGKL